MGRVRILDVSQRVALPPVDGATTRISQLLRHLSASHEVRQFSLARLEDVRRRPFPREVQATPAYLEHRHVHPGPLLAWELCRRASLRESLLDLAGLRLCRPRRLREWMRWADVVLVEYPFQFAYCHGLRPHGPLVLSTCNVEVDNRLSYAAASGRSAAGSARHRRLEAIERYAVTHADLVLAVSSEDRDAFVSRYGASPERVAVIPNGADTARLRPVADAERRHLRAKLGLPERPTAIFLAGGGNAARRAALAWVRRLAARRPDTTFVVTGTLFPRPAVEANVVATGGVDDPLPYLQAADVSLCPVEFGGGTKIKVLESLAVGLPTLVFSETTRGLALRHGREVWVAEKDEESLAAALRRLLEDEGLRDRLGAAGRRLVVERHDWAAIGAALERELLRLAVPRPGAVGEGHPPNG